MTEDNEHVAQTNEAETARNVSIESVIHDLRRIQRTEKAVETIGQRTARALERRLASVYRVAMGQLGPQARGSVLGALDGWKPDAVPLDDDEQKIRTLREAFVREQRDRLSAESILTAIVGAVSRWRHSEDATTSMHHIAAHVRQFESRKCLEAWVSQSTRLSTLRDERRKAMAEQYETRPLGKASQYEASLSTMHRELTQLLEEPACQRGAKEMAGILSAWHDRVTDARKTICALVERSVLLERSLERAESDHNRKAEQLAHEQKAHAHEHEQRMKTETEACLATNECNKLADGMRELGRQMEALRKQNSELESECRRLRMMAGPAANPGW